MQFLKANSQITEISEAGSNFSLHLFYTHIDFTCKLYNIKIKSEQVYRSLTLMVGAVGEVPVHINPPPSLSSSVPKSLPSPPLSIKPPSPPTKFPFGYITTDK
jgi:hypothetical protein